MQHVLGPGRVQRVAGAQGGGGAVHDVGRAHQVQHGGVVEVVAKGHDLGGGDAQRFAKQRHAGALVGQGGVDPVRPGHGGIGLLPAGDEAVNVLFHALVQIDADLDDVLGNLGGSWMNLYLLPMNLRGPPSLSRGTSDSRSTGRRA